jgi:integrase
MTVTEARKEALEALKQIKYGTYSQSASSAPRAILSLSTLSREFLSRREGVLRSSTIADYRMVLEGTYFESWKEVPVNEIARRAVLDQYQALCTRHGVGMANKAMRVLSATLNYSKAVYPELESWANPVRVLSETRSRIPLRPRTSHIKPKDLPNWLSALDAYRDDTTARQGSERQNDIWLFLNLILMTGLRSNEARSLMWCNIDLDHGVLTVPESIAKNRIEARLPLNSWLIAQLSNRGRSLQGRVFPSSCNNGYLDNVRRALKRIEKLSGIPVMPHDLRRSFATYLDLLGVPFGAIKQLLNHVSASDVTSRYVQQRSAEELRSYSEKVCEFVKAALPRPANEQLMVRLSKTEEFSDGMR